MFKSVYYYTVCCAIMLLLGIMPCSAAFPPAKQPGLSMQHIDRATPPAQANAKFDFINTYQAAQQPAPRSNYGQDNKRPVLGLTMAFIGIITLTVGCAMAFGGDKNTQAGRQSRTLGVVAMVVGTALSIIGGTISGFTFQPVNRYY